MSNVLFGDRLRALRKRAGMTQEAVAQHLSIHRTAYTKYETSGVTPDPQGLILLANLFGVSVDYLVGRDLSSGSVTEPTVDGVALSLWEQKLVQMFRQLNYADQQIWVQQAQKSFQQHQKNKKK